MPVTGEIAGVLSDWTRSEVRGDTTALEALLAEDFAAVGPLGFTLSKQDWLDRHRTGSLSYDTFELQDLQLRVYGEAAVVTARQTVYGAYQGHPVPAALRITLVVVPLDNRWQLAAAHMSFIAGTPGAPPIPGRG